jgi:hypothetical protein
MLVRREIVNCWRSGVPFAVAIRPIHDIQAELQWQEDSVVCRDPRRVWSNHDQPATRRRSTGRAPRRDRQPRAMLQTAE